MPRLPQAIRFFRKPDHISFLSGFALILISTITNLFEIKLASTVFFSFTLAYELYEISKGGRDFVKLDHFTFVIGYALLLISFWYDLQLLLVLISILFGFTLAYEVYRVRKMDLENRSRDMR